MKQRRAIPDIAVDASKGWVLPTFGSDRPSQFRYWAHVHFEKDPARGERTWTLLVDLEKSPDAFVSKAEATVYFMARNAPEHLLEEGAKFELVCGESHCTNGVIKRVFEVESSRPSSPPTTWRRTTLRAKCKPPNKSYRRSEPHVQSCSHDVK